MPTPKAQATNPTESAVLPMGMETSIALLPAPDEYGLRHRLRPAEGHHNCVSLAHLAAMDSLTLFAARAARHAQPRRRCRGAAPPPWTPQICIWCGLRRLCPVRK